MLFLEQVYNSLRVPGFLVNSLPKAGTHLLEKTVASFPGIRSSGITLARKMGIRLSQTPDPAGVTVPLGVESPVLAARSRVRDLLRQVTRGSYAFGHVPFSPEMASLLQERGIKSLLILRDPRDVVVSRATYYPITHTYWLSSYFQALSPEERITQALVGVAAAPGGGMTRGVKEALESVLPWCEQSFNYTTTFEQLVGERGGGSRAAQLRAIGAIAQHLGVRCSYSKIETIADSLFGGTPTFNRGMIGAWRECFTPAQKQLAKELLGQLLIVLGYEKDWDW
jgi:hypothetical protein